jgi:hypothetical protein
LYSWGSADLRLPGQRLTLSHYQPGQMTGGWKTVVGRDRFHPVSSAFIGEHPC